MSTGSPEKRSADAALRALGVRCTVEPRAQLAVVIPAPGERALEDADVRQRVLATLHGCGFTHVAVELSHVGEPVVGAGDSYG